MWSRQRWMYANSRVPTSTQQGVHAQLPRLLERHARVPFRKPYADYNQRAFAISFARYQGYAAHAPLILDSCCGGGESSLRLATEYASHYVIGVDQSAVRLGRSTAGAAGWPANLDLVRADVVDFWRLLRDAGVRLDQHYLLYPNPWPKIGHLGRRWHGHAVFPALLELGGVLECRSNWEIYLAEHCLAVQRLTGRTVSCQAYVPTDLMTPFERKYAASGHRLWRAVVDLR